MMGLFQRSESSRGLPISQPQPTVQPRATMEISMEITGVPRFVNKFNKIIRRAGRFFNRFQITWADVANFFNRFKITWADVANFLNKFKNTQGDDDPVLDPEIIQKIASCVEARGNVIKRWKEVYAVAKSMLIYSSSAMVAYLFFYISKNQEQQIDSSSKEIYHQMVFFGTTTMAVTGVGAAIFVFAFNWNALCLASGASRRYQRGKLKELHALIKAKGLNGPTMPSEVTEMALPLSASRWVYMMGCFIVLVGSAACCIYQLNKVCSLSYAVNSVEAHPPYSSQQNFFQ